MRVHIEIRIHLKLRDRETLHDVLRGFASSAGGWKFPVAKSNAYQTLHANPAGYASSHDVDDVERAAVAIANVNPRFPNSFHVTNIVPQNCSSLSLTQYNAIGEAFVASFRRFLRKRGRGESVETEGPEIGLPQIIRPPKCRQLFEAYLKTPTPTGHPSDILVLDRFICALSRRNVYVDVDKLERHLVQDKNWSSESASWVARRIQTGLDILGVNRKF